MITIDSDDSRTPESDQRKHSKIVKDSIKFGDMGTREETPDLWFGTVRKDTIKWENSSDIDSDPDEELL